MAKTLTTRGDGTPIFEAQQSGTSAIFPAPPRSQIQQLQQYPTISESKQNQQGLDVVQSRGKVTTDSVSEGGLRNASTENGAIVVGMLVQCGECGKKFINSYYLEKHINKRHRSDIRQSTVTRLENPHMSTLGTSAFHQAFDSVRTAISAPLTILEQQQQQQITQQQQLLQQQQTLQQQQHLLQQQLSLLSAAALRASDAPKTTGEIHQPPPMAASVGGALLEEAGGTLGSGPGRNSSASPVIDYREQTISEVKSDVQKEIQKAVKPPQHRDTAAVLLDELKEASLRETKKGRSRRASGGAPSRTTEHKTAAEAVGPAGVHLPLPLSVSAQKLAYMREFMARSQLPDVLRHNNKPPPDEVEKQLELPPGTLSCQLANYLLHPAVAGQRSGVTTSNAPQNSDSLNLPWPAPHGVGGCCYHLHKPPPPPRTFSVRAKLQQLMQRFASKPATSPIGCPETQQASAAANVPLQSPRQRWNPPPAVAPTKVGVRNLGNNAPVRLNGAQLVMQHGGQARSVSVPPLGAQKQPQQILPYTIDGGAAQSPAGANPLTANTPRVGVLPVAAPGAPLRSEPVGLAQQRQQPPEQNIGPREKSKSITEREVGTVLPALAWGGDEAIPSEEDLALPEPKSPFYPARNPADGNKVAPIFPPCSSWTPIEPPPTATSVPLSVLHAALAANGMAIPPHAGTAVPASGRQTTSQVQQQQASNQLPPDKHQLPQPVFTQQLGPHSFGVDFVGSRLQAASTNEELSGVQLRAPESAFGVFEGHAGASAAPGQGGAQGNAEYLPSARGSRTLPEDAGWTTTTYQAQNDLGPWQFAGLT
ncbi:uncharacterized protein EMH_0043240 [Eimeria mitis]|uniref:C2H2-type domain-containing protein n=1 Tax=Eimeria mitis TaxID=44415 RepID=U6K3N1_9EIME|nr:uncharacterized protein EMH_0043240 [Eimeria mitis]CDJ32304.1 hypothetical protein, conserved [Eimeria mitis]